MNRRRVWIWLGQAILLALVAWFAANALGRHWGELRTTAVALRPAPGWIALGAVLVFASYALLIAAWRWIIMGWGERLDGGQALRVWALSNLGRYLPGKVWAVAGLAVLAQRAGVSAWGAVGSALVVQAVALGTGVAVVIATVPAAASPWWLALAVAVALLTTVTFVSARGVALIGRLVPRARLKPLSLAAVGWATVVTTVSWGAYGVALWCLAHGLFDAQALTPVAATGAFAAAYIVGLLALFAPGGVIVREGVLAAALTPVLGPGPALALSVASRVLLTVTELLAALAGALVRPAPVGERAGAD